MPDEKAVSEFIRLGYQASYHYADDTCKEWDDAYKCRDEAMDLYRRADTPTRAAMHLVARAFLWYPEFERILARSEEA